MRLAARTTYSDSSLCDSDSLCSTVATSSELVATVDHDGHRINSARARTPHEPLSVMLMRVACSSRAVEITLTSAHWQRVGRQPERPLNVVSRLCTRGFERLVHVPESRVILLWGVTRCSDSGAQNSAK